MEYSPAPESPDIAHAWLKERKAKFGLFLNGKWYKAKSGKVFGTKNPATGEKLASISLAGKNDVALTSQRLPTGLLLYVEPKD